MAGFYATKLGIFKEVEIEADKNVQPGPVENPEGAVEQPVQQQNTQTDAGQQPETQNQQYEDNTEPNPEQNQQQPEEDTTVDTIPNEDPSAGGDVNNVENSNQSQGTEATQPGDPSPVDDIKKKEEEIYADLTPEELDIKHKELKDQFLAMFDMTTDIIERINNISLDPEYIPIVEYASNNLAKLRTMLSDYMNSVYKTKSYTENHINYNRFLATLNGISKILEEINKNED